MTAKDFTLIAAAIRPLADAMVEEPGEYLAGYWTGVHDVAVSLADALATTNPRFDRERFMHAALDDRG